MNIQGKIHEISDVVAVTEKFKKKSFVLECYGDNDKEHKYPEYILFDLVQEKVSLLDGISVGANANVSFNIKGRAWSDNTGKKKFFNSLQAWSINVSDGSNKSAIKPNEKFEDPTDDLPF